MATQVRFDGRTTSVSQTVYTAGVDDEILQINWYLEVLSGSVSNNELSYTDAIGLRHNFPSGDGYAFTIKVKSGTTVDLALAVGASTSFNYYLVITSLWVL